LPSPEPGEKRHSDESARRVHSQTQTMSWAIEEVGPMCDHLPSKNRRDLAADVPQPEQEVPARRQPLTVDDLRRLAEACRNLDDPAVTAKAWDDPHDIREGMRAADSMHETAPTTKHPRRFCQLPNLAVPENIDKAAPPPARSIAQVTSPPSACAVTALINSPGAAHRWLPAARALSCHRCRRPRRRVLTQRSDRTSQLAVESSRDAGRPIDSSHTGQNMQSPTRRPWVTRSLRPRARTPCKNRKKYAGLPVTPVFQCSTTYFGDSCPVSVQLAGFAVNLASDGLTADSQWSWHLQTMPARWLLPVMSAAVGAVKM
jgi:hypothetical protein